MTDLVARLKEWKEEVRPGGLVVISPPPAFKLRLEAAARIEELEAENKMLRQVNSRHIYNYADDTERNEFDAKVRQEMQAIGIVR